MNIAQALAIAAAAWVTAMDGMPLVSARFDQTIAGAGLEHIERGFRATPDGVCIERHAAPR